VKKLLFIYLVVFIAACSSFSEPKVENTLVSLNEQNFEEVIPNIVKEVGKYDSKIGGELAKCDVAIAVSDGYEVRVDGDMNTCLILFVPASLTHMEMLKEFAPPTDGKGFTSALTSDFLGNEYPVIFVGEREFDFFYLTRVFAHEAIHMINIKNQADCTLTPVCEEFNAYQTHFKILEDMYSKDLLNSGVNSYALSNSSDLLLRALDMELFLYQKNKEGKLEQALIEMRYNSQGQ